MLIEGNLANLAEDLKAGSIVVLHDSRIHARRLPIIPRDETDA